MIKIIKNVSGSEKIWQGHILQDGDYLTIQMSDYMHWMEDPAVVEAIASGTALMNDGSADITDPVLGLAWLNAAEAKYEPRDTSGKLRVHTTRRKLGLDTFFTGSSDLTSTFSDSGNGSLFFIEHKITTIATQSRASNIATMTTASAHGLSVNDRIRIDGTSNGYDCTYTLVSSVPSTTSFTYSSTGTDEAETSSTGSFSLDPNVLYADFNIASNETWLLEGTMTWYNPNHVIMVASMEIVPIVTTTALSSGKNYAYGTGAATGLILPAAGNGNCDVLSDLTTPRGGLFYIPNSDQGDTPGYGDCPSAFWDATWNSTTSTYSNITPAIDGHGRYNLFAGEGVIKRFVNKVPLIACEGSVRLSSDDSAQLGQGTRLKTSVRTIGSDSAWKFAFNLTMHRKKTR